MSHEMFVILSYAASAIVIIGMILWVFFDGRARSAEISKLEADGIKRRSDLVQKGDDID